MSLSSNSIEIRELRSFAFPHFLPLLHISSLKKKKSLPVVRSQCLTTFCMQALTLIIIGRPLPLSAKTKRPFFGQKKRPRLVEAAAHQGRIISAAHRSKANYTFFSCSVLNVMNEPDLRIYHKNLGVTFMLRQFVPLLLLRTPLKLENKS